MRAMMALKENMLSRMVFSGELEVLFEVFVTSETGSEVW